jgi:hypothetical protein
MLLQKHGEIRTLKKSPLNNSTLFNGSTSTTTKIPQEIENQIQLIQPITIMKTQTTIVGHLTILLHQLFLNEPGSQERNNVENKNAKSIGLYLVLIAKDRYNATNRNFSKNSSKNVLCSKKIV